MMQQLSPSFLSVRREFVDGGSQTRDVQVEHMTCPDCETLCRAIGMVQKSWYTLCRCGTYIQKCMSDDDYSD